MEEIVVGYMGLSKASWKTPEISAMAKQARSSLEALPAARVISAPDLITTEAEAIALSEKFRRENVDAVIMHFASFPVGAIIPAAARRIDAPIILFANPEEAKADGVWSQNSFCGANMAAHVLHKMGRKYRFAWAKSDLLASAAAVDLKAASAIRDLHNARIGLVGGRVPGFYTSNFDEMKLRNSFGTTVEVIDLLELTETAKTLAPAESARGLQTLRKSSSQVCAVSDKELKLAGDLFAAFLKLGEKYHLDSFAIRCWPEFSDIYGIAPCAVIGLLNDAGIASSCEGDIPGVLTMKIEQSLSGGGTPFFVDLISFDYDDNTGVVWHCGAAPSKLCRRFEETVLRKHGRVDGGDKKGVTNDFSLKAGRVTMAKLDETPEGYRMLIAPGTALDTDRFIRGNPLRIRFDGEMKTIINTIMKDGFEHHYSVVHADIKNELQAFCELNNIKPVIID